MIGSKNAQNGDFIAGLELRAAYAVLPRFERERPAFDHVKAHSVEEIYNISEGEDGVEFVLYGFGNQRFYEFAADTLGLGMLVHGQGADFGGGGTVEVQGAAAQHLAVERDHGEIADGFRHFKFSSGQHDAAAGIAVDEVQNGRDIVHHGFADGEAGRRAGRVHEGVGIKGADHAVTIRRSPSVCRDLRQRGSVPGHRPWHRERCAPDPRRRRARSTTRSTWPAYRRWRCRRRLAAWCSVWFG